MAVRRDFWKVIAGQLDELRSAKSADDVVRILSHECNPYDDPSMAGGCDGFFAGSGGDETVRQALGDAGWAFERGNRYYYVMRSPGGDYVTYCEGDIYLGDRMAGAVDA